MRKNANSFPDKNLRGDPRLLGAVQGRTPTSAGDCETHHVPGSTIVTPRRKRAAKAVTLPFHVILIPGGTAEVPTYEVTVGWGYVCERVPGPYDAVAYHAPANQYEEVDPPTDPKTFTDKLAKFRIAAGEAVYVKVAVDANGIINPPAEGEDAVTIVVAAEDEASIHYQPKVDNETSAGSAGTMSYKLAALEEGENEGDKPTFKKFLTGSHLDHYQELPSILSTLLSSDPEDGIGVVPKEWSESFKAYRLRALSKELGKLTIRTDPDEIVVRGNMKDADVKVYYGTYTESDPLLKFRDGLEDTGQTVIGNEDPAVELLPKEILIPTIEARADPQVNVTNTNGGVGGPVYRIEGNGKKRTIKYQIGTETAVEFATFDDGLETSGANPANEIIIPIPAAGTVLPTGSAGDMLYWSGPLAEWIPLSAPAAPPSGTKWVLHHDGAAPVWVLYNEITVNVCISGVPTEYTILGIPTV